MDFLGKLNAKNTFGMFEKMKSNNIINIICGVLLIILIVVLIICLVRKNDNFSNQKENNNLSDCQVIMFDREGCGFSAKMKKLVEDNNNMIGDMKVCIVDMTREKELANKHNITGTPTFVLIENPSIVSVGFAPLEVHESKLKKTNISKNSKTHRFVGTDTCPFCNKAKELLKELNIQYENIDSNSPEGIKLMKEGNDGKGVNGVPYIITTDGIEIIGYDVPKIKNMKN